MTNFADIGSSRSSLLSGDAFSEQNVEEDPATALEGPGKGAATESTKAQAAASALISTGETTEVGGTDEVDGKDEVEGGGETEGGVEGGEGGEEVAPALPPTLAEPGKISFLTDLTGMLNSLQLTQQKQNAEKTASEIKASSKDRQAKLAEQMDKIAKKLQDMEKNKVLNFFKKLFAVIGAIIGAIAGALAIAGAVATGNPLLAAAGIMAIVASIDAIMSTASDGKVSIAAGITAALEAAGVNKETAGWAAFAIQMAMIVVTVALGFASGGGTAASAVSNIASMASKTENVAKVMAMIEKATKLLNIAGTMNQATVGGVGIGSAVVEGDIKQNEADQKAIEGTILKIKAIVEQLMAFFQVQMEQTNKLVDSVKEILAADIETKTKVQRAAVS